MATIVAGDRIPNITVRTWKDDKITPLQTEEVFKGKKAVLFAVPGAFTPTCSNTHCPSFVRDAKRLKEKGVDLIACTAVNDVFVMDAWSKSQKADGVILMLADGNGELAKAVGMLKDGSAAGLGIRSKRYAMIIDDGVVKYVAVDESGAATTSADAIIAKL